MCTVYMFCTYMHALHHIALHDMTLHYYSLNRNVQTAMDLYIYI